ncbi:MAG: diaminopimelate decarboxylase, partial [Muribaculaceae bacterium]|nr:diaminopimelate decarboxylase [Muribaculaceae bacterium]
MILRGNFPTDKFKELETPFYYYDLDVLRLTLRAIDNSTRRDSAFCVHYAVKANANPMLLR